MDDLYYCQVSYVFGSVRTGISRASNGNDSGRRNESASRIGAMRFRSRLRMGAVIYFGGTIHGGDAYRLSPISRKIWAALEECPTEIPDAYRLGRFRCGPAQSVLAERPYRVYRKKGGCAIR